MKTQKRSLIFGDNSQEEIPERLISSVEPIFPVTETTDLRFPAAYRGVLGTHFCHRVTRNPRDLLSHVRRIVFAYEHEADSGLFPALLDLFIALGNKGHSLRKRVLELAKSRLDKDQYTFLHDALAGGLDERQVPLVPGSFLHHGLEGNLTLVHLGVQKSDEPRDPLIEAREFLEYSQLDEARILLEAAILLAPQRVELHEELLDIYRSTRDEVSFFQMLEELNGVTNPVPGKWQEMAEFFRSRNG